MRKSILFITAMFLSTCGFAQTSALSVKNLGAVWKSQHAIKATLDKNDIAIVYGGADVSRKPTLILQSTTA